MIVITTSHSGAPAFALRNIFARVIKLGYLSALEEEIGELLSKDTARTAKTPLDG